MAEPPTGHGTRYAPFARWFLILLASAAGLWLLYQIRTIIALVAIAYLIAYIFDPVIDRLEAWHIPRTVGILMIGLVIAGAIVGVTLTVIPEMRRQTAQLIAHAPEWGGRIYEKIQPVLDELQISINRENLERYAQKLLSYVQENIPRLASPIIQAIRNMFTGIANFIVGVFYVIIVPVMAFYFLRDYDRIREGFYRYVPPHWRPTVRSWLTDIDRVLGGFLRGQFLIAMILALLYATGLTLLDVPLGFLLGLISGLANMIPYMAAVVGVLPAMVLSLMSEGSLIKLIWILALYEAGQLLEGLILGPRITGHTTGLHPAVVIISIMIGGTLMGIWGILLAVPVAGILKVAFLRWFTRQQARWQAAAPESDALE